MIRFQITLSADVNNFSCVFGNNPVLLKLKRANHLNYFFINIKGLYEGFEGTKKHFAKCK